MSLEVQHSQDGKHRSCKQPPTKSTTHASSSKKGSFLNKSSTVNMADGTVSTNPLPSKGSDEELALTTNNKQLDDSKKLQRKKETVHCATTTGEDNEQKKKKVKQLDVDEDNLYNDSFVYAEDAFVMLFLGGVRSWAFVYGLIIFIMQVLVLSLSLVDLIGNDDPDHRGGNNLNVPPSVDKVVTAAQGVAMLIAVLVRDDLETAIHLSRLGFDPEIQKQFPGASLFSFWIATAMHFIEGVLVFMVTFVFIVQSDDVIAIFMDFAAVEFVAGLDETAFRLAKNNWGGRRLTTLARRIENGVHQKERRQAFDSIFRPLLVIFLLFLFYLPWAVTVSRQKNGTFLKTGACKSVHVKFGTEVYSAPTTTRRFGTEFLNGIEVVAGSTRPLGYGFSPSSPPDLHFSYFTADYRAKFSDLWSDRPVYYERGFEDPTSGMFYYCQDEKAWVFTIPAFVSAGLVPKDTVDRCGKGWLLRSPRTESFYLEQVPSEGWNIWTGRLSMAQSLNLSCRECLSNLDCSGVERGTCGKNNKCVCNEGHEGPFCDFDTPCPDLTMYYGGDEVSEGLQKANFTLLAPELRFYDRAIWVKDELVDLDRPEQAFEVLMYTGMRWYGAYVTLAELAIFSGKPLPVSTAMNSTLTEMLQAKGFAAGNSDTISMNMHAYWGNMLIRNTVYFTGVTTRFEPTGPLEWRQIHDSKSVGNYGPFGANFVMNRRFECLDVDCDIPRVCGNFGTCVAHDRDSLNSEDSGGMCVCSGADTLGQFCEFEAQPEQ